MNDDKFFLTYNQQMRKLRNDKHIICEGSAHKKILIRAGYFNIVNGYKTPFVSGCDANGSHSYISGTSIAQLQAVKNFDDHLRSFLLRYITQIEEEIRNSCAHNERVYCLTRRHEQRGRSGRILEKYLRLLGGGYVRDPDQRIFDLIIYFKYFLPKSEYKQFISDLKNMLLNLQSKIHPHAFEYVRGQIGIKNLPDLDVLLNLPKDEIEYNRFDR